MRRTYRGAVNRVRTFIRHHYRLASLLLMLALAMKAFVPAGYMVAPKQMSLAVVLCSGMGADDVAQISIPMDGDERHDATKASQDCPATSLGHAWLPAVDPLLLAGAIAFVMALGFRAVAAPRLLSRRYLIPPSQAPPLPI